jgi:CheY-like chemotaxis protein
MFVLLVEDEDPKRDHVLATLKRIAPGIEVVSARGVRSAVAAVRARTPDLILLDMSLPTFDQSAKEPGGRPQGFGGIEVMRYMDRFGIVAPVIVVTGYDAFSHDGRSIDHEALSHQLAAEHPETFRGLVYYNTVFGEWDKTLEDLMAIALPTWRRSDK